MFKRLSYVTVPQVFYYDTMQVSFLYTVLSILQQELPVEDSGMARFSNQVAN